MEVTTSTRSRTRNSRRSCAETGQTLAEGSTFAPRQTSRSRRCSAPPSGPGGTSRTGAAADDLYYPSVPSTTSRLVTQRWSSTLSSTRRNAGARTPRSGNKVQSCCPRDVVWTKTRRLRQNNTSKRPSLCDLYAMWPSLCDGISHLLSIASLVNSCGEVSHTLAIP
jgi:hypothetical protein